MIKKYIIFAIFSLLFATGVVFADSEKKYIIVFNDSVTDEKRITSEMEFKHGIKAEEKYSYAIKGFSANLSDNKLKKIKEDSRVAFVSEDREINIVAKPIKGGGSQPAQKIPSGIKRIGADLSSVKGTGVGVAVIDTGIDLKHSDLTQNIANASKTCVIGTRSANDDNGHGTHVAGIIAGVDNSIGVVGVAPDARLFAVKVLDKNGSGSWSSVICGIDWITANATQYGIKVANMSLAGTGTSDNNCGNTNSDALHKAICRSVDAGVTYVVAASNDGSNASNYVPAAYDDAVITVSALVDTDGKSGGLGLSSSYGKDDTFASFTNYGPVVDVGAPGVNIYSTWKGGTYKTISGTSMAAPHVAGAVALHLQTNKTASWTDVKNMIISLGEALDAGHSDPGGRNPEPVVLVNSL